VVWRDHKLLEIDGVVGVLSAVEDVHAGHRKVYTRSRRQGIGTRAASERSPRRARRPSKRRESHWLPVFPCLASRRRQSWLDRSHAGW
jgi:hypothetical protein